MLKVSPSVMCGVLPCTASRAAAAKASDAGEEDQTEIDVKLRPLAGAPLTSPGRALSIHGAQSVEPVGLPRRLTGPAASNASKHRRLCGRDREKDFRRCGGNGLH
ncbi:hypothetical protein GCM10009593_17140 [Microlunatus antarcticus]